MEADLITKSDQKITDQEQFLILEMLSTSQENTDKEMHAMRNNTVELNRAMKDIEEMNLRFEGGKLVFEPTKDALGVMMRDFDPKDYLHDVTKVRIEWGVDQYPLGADWSGPVDQTRNTREAISFMIFFGEKKLNSGFFLAPDLPYFISLFLGKDERPDQVSYKLYNTTGANHPLKLRVSSGGAAVTEGVNAMSNGTTTYTVPMTVAAGTTYVYQCELHSAMMGTITIA